MLNIDLTDSVVFSLTVEKNKTLNKTFQCEIYDQDNVFKGYFPFSAYTGASLTVKTKANSFNTIIEFNTSNNSIVLSENGEFTLSKSAIEMNIKSGEYVYEMYLTSADEKRGFLRGRFYVYDQSYGEVEQDVPTTQPIRIKVKSSVAVITGGTTQSGSTSNIYDGLSPASITLGGINSGYVLTGKTYTQLFQDLLVPTLNPTLTAPSITSFTQNLASTQEVGVSVTPTFTVNFSRGSISPQYTSASPFRSGTPTKYVFSGSGNSRQVNSTSTSNTSAATGATILVAGANTWGVYVAYAGGVQPKNSSGGDFGSPLPSGSTAVAQTTITGIYPYFYGKSSSRPTASSSLVNSGTKVVSSSNGTISITYNASSEFIWFAIPAASTSKTVWYVSALNNGSIGGIVSAGGNLFPDPDSVTVNTVLWNGILYKVYISNYATTTASAMEMRNS
jgi:hypothetical protein